MDKSRFFADKDKLIQKNNSPLLWKLMV